MSPARKVVVGLDAELCLADMVRLAEANKRTGNRNALDRLIRRVEKGTEELTDLIARTYFSHSMPQQVSGPIWAEQDR